MFFSYDRVSFLNSLPEVSSGELGVGSELLLNPEELVVLGQPLGPARGPGLDLAGTETHHQVSDEAVLSLARPDMQECWQSSKKNYEILSPVRHHGAPALGLGHVVRLDRLRHAADLVDLEKKAVAGLLIDSGGDPLGVGDKEVVTYDLDLSAGGQLGVALPVILVEGILNTDNRVVLDEA